MKIKKERKIKVKDENMKTEFLFNFIGLFHWYDMQPISLGSQRIKDRAPRRNSTQKGAKFTWTGTIQHIKTLCKLMEDRD
jgi:hypothetical protein